MEPIARRVTRYLCPFCRRGRSSRSAAERHIARCYGNPAARSCKTCALWEPSEKSDPLFNYPGCPESCGAGVPLSIGTMPIGCEHWEPRE